MSDEQPPETPVVSEVRDMVEGPSGGKLMRGGPVRPANPTPADVSAMARKRLYQVIPQLNRIATNKARRENKRKNARLKRPFSVANQLRAIAELRMIAYEDRVPMSALRDALMGMTDDMRGFLPQETAEALIALIAPRFIGLSR